MNLRRPLLAALLCVAGGVAHAPAAQDSPPPLATIAKADHYAWGHVGTPAAPTAAESAARGIAGQVTAPQLEAALSSATTAGRLYLLCLLVRADPGRFRVQKAALLAGTEKTVSTFTGNVLSMQPVDGLLADIETSRCSPLNWRP